MDEEMREKMTVTFDQLSRTLGAPSFEVGMMQVKMLTGMLSGWLVFVNNFVQPIQTIDDLREAFESRMSLSAKEQVLLLQVLQNMPQILRQGISTIAKDAASTLPPPPAGRKPAFTATQAQEVLDYVSELNRKGAQMRVAKSRAAQKFGCSQRTIERLWVNRESVALEEPPSVQELIRIVLQAGAEDGWKAPVGLAAAPES